MSQTWTEKYRPRCLVDVVGQQEVIQALNSHKISGELPHLLFHGPAGTGKTSTILALAREIYGEIGCEVLELNASDERGISTVREKIKTFSKLAINEGFKLVILDEADAMTFDAQAALRRIIEINHKTTRFCFVCNYLHKIIPPLISRCSVHRFKPITAQEAALRLDQICRAENLSRSIVELEKLFIEAGNDLRYAISCLQYSMVPDTIPPNLVSEFFYSALKSPTNCSKLVQKILMNGYSIELFLDTLHTHLIKSTLSSIQKASIAQSLSDTQSRILQRGSSTIQLLSLGYRIHASNQIQKNAQML